MTDATTTSDKLAAWELIEKHGLDLSGNRGGSRTCVGPFGVYGTGLDDVAAVRAWAEAAGVPWPSVNVVPMWALDGAIGVPIYGSRILAEQSAHLNRCRVVPCEVVIRTETEATP